MEIISGIYKITNLITNDFYIGSSKDIYLRWKDHKKPSSLKRYKSQMYKDFINYGLSNFKFEIIYKADAKDDIKLLEANYISELQPSYNNLNYIPKKYDDTGRICGVYKIVNKITGDFYIGSSSDIKARWHCHKNSNNYKRYPNSKLYNAMFKYGVKNFEFTLIEECSREDLLSREQYYIDTLKPDYNSGVAKAILPPAERKKLYYEKNIEKIKERRAKWKEKNKKHESDHNRAYYSRLCCFNGETLKLGTLAARFRQQGISNATVEAKKYLISLSSIAN